MSKDLDMCTVCSEDYCERCFYVTPCEMCQCAVCEDCYDKLKECQDCGERLCPENCDHICDDEEEAE